MEYNYKFIRKTKNTLFIFYKYYTHIEPPLILLKYNNNN